MVVSDDTEVNESENLKESIDDEITKTKDIQIETPLETEEVFEILETSKMDGLSKKQEISNTSKKDIQVKTPEENQYVETSKNFKDVKIVEIEKRGTAIKKHEINLDKIKTSLELKYATLKLDNINDIKMNNFPKTAKITAHFEKGKTVVKVGNRVLNDVKISLLIYEKLNSSFKILELEKNEFKIQLSIDINNNILNKKDDYYAYQITKNLKNKKLLETLDILEDIFSGKSIEFKIDDFNGNVIFPNIIEQEKFEMIREAVYNYSKIYKKLKLYNNKNFTSLNTSFYSLYLLKEYLANNKKFDSWINLTTDNNYSIAENDQVSFYKIHKFEKLDFNLKETIILNTPIQKRELSNGKITFVKKDATVLLSKINK